MTTPPKMPDAASRAGHAAMPSASATRLPRWPRVVLAACLAVTALAGFTGCAALDRQQREWIFQPSDRTWWGGLSAAQGMEEVWIDFQPPSGGSAVRLHGLWLPQARADAPVLLYLHGARYDVRGSAPRMRRMHELGFAVLGVDYRGFGRSSAGLPSEAQAYEDARAAWDWLATRHANSRRYVFGHSLGGAIAVHLASEVQDEAGLIVEASFPSIPDVVSTFKWGWLPLAPLITQKLDAGSRIGRVGSPVLVVHGDSDSLIQPALGQQLYERAAEPKRFLLVAGGSHHSTNALAQPQYRQALADLFGLVP
jgi:uncharacterized protein